MLAVAILLGSPFRKGIIAMAEKMAAACGDKCPATTVLCQNRK